MSKKLVLVFAHALWILIYMRTLCCMFHKHIKFGFLDKFIFSFYRISKFMLQLLLCSHVVSQIKHFHRALVGVWNGVDLFLGSFGFSKFFIFLSQFFVNAMLSECIISSVMNNQYMSRFRFSMEYSYNGKSLYIIWKKKTISVNSLYLIILSWITHFSLHIYILHITYLLFW